MGSFFRAASARRFVRWASEPVESENDGFGEPSYSFHNLNNWVDVIA